MLVFRKESTIAQKCSGQRKNRATKPAHLVLLRKKIFSIAVPETGNRVLKLPFEALHKVHFIDFHKKAADISDVFPTLQCARRCSHHAQHRILPGIAQDDNLEQHLLGTSTGHDWRCCLISKRRGRGVEVYMRNLG
jgi:hypothetical protein